MSRIPTRLLLLPGALLLAAQLGLAALWSGASDRAVLAVLAVLLGFGTLLIVPAVRHRLKQPRWLLLAFVGILIMCGVPAAPQLLPLEPGILASRQPVPDCAVPAWTAHGARVQESLKEPIPVVRLTDGIDDAQRLAQDVALQDARVQAKLRDQSGAALRNEVFSVRVLSPGDITEATAGCAAARCLRVELYHYATNSATVALVDADRRQVIAVEDFPQMQPDIPQPLKDVAVQIAVQAPEVAQALGTKPDAAAATMAEMKTSLNDTRCERSQHLCVAPTFLVGEKALWAIIDLTDGALVGVQWTSLGASNTPKITEKTIQDSAVMARLCDQSPGIERDGWKLNYMLFSSAAVPAYAPPTITDIQQDGQVVGFAIDQEFRHPGWPLPCSYNYHQRYELYRDGRFRTTAASWGRGCGNNGMYRPVLRIDLAGDQNHFAAWDGATWAAWPTERWQLQTDDTRYTPEGYQYRVTDAAGQGFFIAPGHGQYAIPPSSDRAYVYVTRHRAEEGDGDMITIGPCCNVDEQQGPEKFIGPSPEGIDGAHLVVWYVPQLKNSDTSGAQACWADSV